jgi:hypothetical protein
MGEVADILNAYFQNHPPDGCWCSFCKNNMMLGIAYDAWHNKSYNDETRFHWKVIYQYESGHIFKSEGEWYV